MPRIGNVRECSKKFVQQGRSPFDARSVLIVREHGKMARTLLAAFFNIPIEENQGQSKGSKNRAIPKTKKIFRKIKKLE